MAGRPEPEKVVSKLPSSPSAKSSRRSVLCPLFGSGRVRFQRVFVIYPGDKDFAMDDHIEVLPLPAVEKLPASLQP
jgi:hypothetical protein